MTHQCLNCGKIIERGSDEILRGCQQCGGKKFIFVSSPLPQERRLDLIKQAESVRADMVRKADPELLRVLRERGVTEIDGSTLEIERSSGGEWLRVRPGPMAPSPTPGPGTPVEPKAKATIEQVEEGPKRPSAREIIFEFDRERLETGASTSKPSDRRRKAQRKPRKKVSGRPKKRVLKGVRKKTPKRPSPKKRGPPPLGTVNVVEQGVYEIDVERLLRDDPVIIENDGTYLIHLPSMLKEGPEARTKQKR